MKKKMKYKITCNKFMFNIRAEGVTNWAAAVKIKSCVLSSQAGKGMLRSMIGDLNAVADIIPVDFSANMMLSIAWHRVVKR